MHAFSSTHGQSNPVDIINIDDDVQMPKMAESIMITMPNINVLMNVQLFFLNINLTAYTKCIFIISYVP